MLSESGLIGRAVVIFVTTLVVLIVKLNSSI